jgi:DNA-binding CsgD family transcriptional regulator
MAGSEAFIGREYELSRLRAALGDRTRLVLVVGEAGIGKTRFVGAGLARAAAGGMSVISGGCLPLAEKLPLLPVADALGELTRLEGGAPFEAALEAAPAYVRPEVARLLPGLSASELVAGETAEGWRYERLFAGMAELLDEVARRSPVAVLIEDVHWADTATLDFLTYQTRAGQAGVVTAVVTCRSDEVPLDAPVADWLTNVRRNVAVEEIRLGPLSYAQVAEQVSELVGRPVPVGLAEEVYARAEGHPFFTEQLVAAAVTDSGRPAQPVPLPARLAELLIARVGRYGTDAHAVLNALAVAGRPLTEELLGEVTGLDPRTLGSVLRELTAAQLLAALALEGHRLRHELLGEALAAQLLPGERLSLHECIANALQLTGDESLAAEAAGHWAAAGRAREELQARLTAAKAAERVYAYADAAAHWQRAIELYDAHPDVDLEGGIDIPHMYIRGVDALNASGETVRAGAIADEAYCRFADHPDRAIAALVHFRAGEYREYLDSPSAGLPLMKEALRLFESTPPSAEHARAWYWYAHSLLHDEGRHAGEILAAQSRALGLAEKAGAAALIPRILGEQALRSFDRGEVEEGFRLLAQARSVPGGSRDALAVLWLDAIESAALLTLGQLAAATGVALRGVEAVKRSGLQTLLQTNILIGNAVAGLLGRGRTEEAARLIDSHTTAAWSHTQLDHWRAEIDLVQGKVEDAAQRLRLIQRAPGPDNARQLGELVAEATVWAGQPNEALERVQRLLERLADTDWVIFCGWLLAVGIRACADLAEQARARRDDQPARAALAAANELASWVEKERNVPFTDHPFVAAIPATRATWSAERRRAAGASDPSEWVVAANRWDALGYRHRAGYCLWRQAEAQLAAGDQPSAAAPAVRAAAVAAVGHVPLLAEIRALARRARIPLDVPSTTASPVSQASTLYGLTERELDVLRLLTHGRSNAEIATELFISPRTAGVHVTNILRKLGVSNRVQAAALAERAGLFDGGQTERSVSRRGIR